jgi:serine phosphatase RsbU (regulator of sigma subunit)
MARDMAAACVRDLRRFKDGAPATDDLTIMVVRRAE